MNTHEFDDIIKQKAQRRQADVPPDIWKGIADKKKKRKKPFAWLIFLVLLIGGSLAFWKINNSNTPVAAVTVKKIQAGKNKDDREKETTATAADNKDQLPVPGKIKNSDLNDTTSKAVLDLNSNNNTVAEERKTISLLWKKTPVINVSSAGSDEKIFLPARQKRDTKGRHKKTIQNSGPAELTGSSNTKNADEVNERKAGSYQKNSSIHSLDTNNHSAGTIIAATTHNNKINITAATPPDSFDTKKITQVNKSSTDKKVTAGKQKNTSLKIEARAAMFFPVQQYEQPLSVQRTLNTTNTATLFSSDKKITSAIESGNGFSVSLVKKLNDKWSVGAGISYLRFTERLQLQGSETSTRVTVVQRLHESPGGNYLQPDTVSSSRTYSTTLFGRNIYSNAGIPLFARYRFSNSNKISCAFTGGFTVNLLRKYSNNMPGEFTIIYADGSKQTGMKNSVGLNAFAGLLVSGRLYNKYEWFAAAEYAYNLTAYETLFNKKIHLPGVSFGVLYELRK